MYIYNIYIYVHIYICIYVCVYRHRPQRLHVSHGVRNGLASAIMPSEGTDMSVDKVVHISRIVAVAFWVLYTWAWKSSLCPRFGIYAWSPLVRCIHPLSRSSRARSEQRYGMRRCSMFRRCLILNMFSQGSEAASTIAISWGLLHSRTQVMACKVDFTLHICDSQRGSDPPDAGFPGPYIRAPLQDPSASSRQKGGHLPRSA